MDVTQALKDAGNAVRDFISAVMVRSIGHGWIEQYGVPTKRIAKWHEREAIEARRQLSGVVEERLLYSADFYALTSILKKNWSGEFAQALGDFKTFEAL